jgi:hypothetical protein
MAECDFGTQSVVVNQSYETEQSWQSRSCRKINNVYFSNNLIDCNYLSSLL